VLARGTDLRRGEIWTVDFGPEIGLHSALLVERTGSMRRRWRAIVAVITPEALDLPTEVTVDERHGLHHESVVDCQDLYTVGADAIVHRVGELDAETQSAVDAALRLALDLRE
jgi:mRNA-degrading endonuclease toxin of MazEF toxin-antitoxin module